MKHNRLRTRSDRTFDAAMTGIPTAVYVVLYLLPCVAGLFFSFTNFGGYSLSFKLIGFANYKKMFADPAFFKSILNFLKLYLGTVLICFPLALGVAIILTKNPSIREKHLYRVIYFFPSTVPAMLIAIMWMAMFNPTLGVLNRILGIFGFKAVQWLGSTKTVMTSITLVVIWRQFGFYMVYFMAGVTSIPTDIFESATIDGASGWRQVFSIIIPLTWEVIRTSMLFYIQSAVNIGFDIVYIMTQGGPDNASQILPTYMYQQMTKNLDYGMASAIGVAMLVVTMVLALVVLKLTKRETYEM